MSTFFSGLCDFFGISAAVPADFAELIPWLCQVLLAICMVWAFWRMLRALMVALTSGGRRV